MTPLRRTCSSQPIRAFRLDWYLPTGWVWIDGLGTTTYEEAVSNPMVVTRVVRMATEHTVVAVDQSVVTLEIDTIRVHAVGET